MVKRSLTVLCKKAGEEFANTRNTMSFVSVYTMQTEIHNLAKQFHIHRLIPQLPSKSTISLA